MFEEMLAAIEASDKVLIGIGHELEHPFFSSDAVNNEDASFYYKAALDNDDMTKCCINGKEYSIDFSEYDKAYGLLKDVLKNKDYYIISLLMDDCIYRHFSPEDNVVTPCGGFRLMQCTKNPEHNKLYNYSDFSEGIEALIRKGEAIDKPICEECKEMLGFNNISVDNYLESGYIEKFAEYKKWLQSTVNRSLCIVELGVSMRYPQVIRFAFDKLCYYNQKSKFYRVNAGLYQHTAENSERGISVRENALKYILDGSEQQ